jgi:hypothetical protein
MIKNSFSAISEYLEGNRRCVCHTLCIAPQMPVSHPLHRPHAALAPIRQCHFASSRACTTHMHANGQMFRDVRVRGGCCTCTV